MAGRTGLALGLGKTGTTVARLCKAMGLTVLGCRARPCPTPEVDEVHAVGDLPGLLARADYVVCCVPLTEATRGLIGATAFAGRF